jgi:hypothetical protein
VRLRTFQTGSASPLVLLKTIAGDSTTERSLHARFGMFRERGEWFRPAPEILIFLLSQSGETERTVYVAGFLDGITMEHHVGVYMEMRFDGEDENEETVFCGEDEGKQRAFSRQNEGKQTEPYVREFIAGCRYSRWKDASQPHGNLNNA